MKTIDMSNPKSINKTLKSQSRKQQKKFPSDLALELITEYQRQLCVGYDDDSWTYATRILTEIGKHVDLKMYHRLGAIMKGAYTHADITEIISACEQVSVEIRRDQVG